MIGSILVSVLLLLKPFDSSIDIITFPLILLFELRALGIDFGELLFHDQVFTTEVLDLLLVLGDKGIVEDFSHSLIGEARTVRILSKGTDNFIRVKIIEDLSETLLKSKEAFSLVEFIGVEDLIIVVLD